MFASANTTPYYQPSGRTPLAGVIIFLVAGVLAAWLLGIAYTYAVEYIPIIYANILATVGFGYALGWVCDRLARIGKLRSPAKVTVLAIIVALAGLWLHWAFFCAFIFNKYGNNYPLVAGYIEHLKSPSEIVDSMKTILAHGHFTLGRGNKTAVTGPVLATIWVIETLIIVGLCAVVSRATSRKPFSETCDCWAAGEKLPAHLPAIADPDAFKTPAESGNIDTLLNAAPVAETEPVYAELTLHAVENDPDCRYLTLEKIAITLDKKGKKQRKSTTIAEHLHITPAQHQKLRARFAPAAPAPQPPAAN
jgi:hypothetical protein